MADEIPVGFTFTGNADELADALSRSLQRAFDKLGPQLARGMAKDFASTFKSADVGRQAFSDIGDEAKKLGGQFDRLADRVDAITSSAQAARGSFGEAFDPRNLDAFESSMRQLQQLMEQIEKGGGDPAILSQLRQMVTVADTAAKSVTTAMRQAELAAREAARDTSATQRTELRQRIADQRAATSRFVVEAQTAASREVAAMRSASAEQVAISRATAQRRAAAFELVGRVVRSTERIIRSVFDNTGNVVSSAFSAMRRGATNVTNNIRQSFSRSNQDIRNEFATSNQAITNSYRSSFRRNTNIVNNELDAQESRVKEFANEATSSIGSIGIGRMGAFAALGLLAGKAIRSGFERAATLEDSERALTALLGSVDQARKLRDEILGVVTGTPFALDQFANAATQLVAFNVEASKVPQYLQAIADAAAVRGGDAAQTIDTLVRVFGQVTTAARISGEDINQISEAGVPALQILGNAFGQTSADMRKMVSDGAVPAEEALAALTKGILEGSDGINGATAAFGGLAQELGTTLRGSIGNLNAAVARMGANIITKFQPLLVSLVRVATESVDVIASALASLAESIQASPVYRVLARLFFNLGTQIESAGEKMKPVFDFIADGLVTLGTALGAVAGIRRIPLLFNAITFAITRLLTPMNLLIAAGIGISALFTRLVEGSPELRDALGRLGNTLLRITTVITQLAAEGLNALFNAISALVTPAVSFLSDAIVKILIPALERLNSFLLTSVLPPIRRFAKMVRDEIIPAIGGFLTKAVEVARQAFANFVNFVRTEVIPVVGPILAKAVEVGRAAFEKAYTFLSTKFVPFVQNNLIPVLSGLAATLGILALGGGFGLAGLAGAGVGIAVALTNEDIRRRVLSFFEGVITNVRERFANMIDSGTLSAIGINVLKVAHKIGQVLGDALSDRRLVTIVAGVAAAAAAVAAAFVTGFGRGVLENVPDLIDMLGDAFVLAFGALTSDPRLIAALVGIFAATSLIRSIRTAGQNAATVFAQGMAKGAGGLGGAMGGGNRLSNFVDGLFGRQGAIAARVEGEMAQARTIMTREVQNMNRIAQKLTGATLGNALDPSQARKINSGFQEMTQTVGAATVAGAQFRVGVSQIGESLRFSGSRMESFNMGLRNIGTSLKQIGPEIAGGAGAIAGGAFAASFISQALFDINSSGADKLRSGIGLLGTGVATGAMIGGPAGLAAGGPAGIAAGAAVVGVGLLTGAMGASGEAAKRARAEVQEYADAIVSAREAAEDATPAIQAVFAGNLRDSSTDVKEALSAIEFNWREFAEAVQSGNLDEEFDSIAEGITGNRLALLIASGQAGEFAERMRAAGINTDDTAEAIEFLIGEVNRIDEGRKVAQLDASLFDTATSAERLGAAVAAAAGATDVARQATQAYRDKMEELNEARLDGLREKVNESKSALDEARSAADQALEALQAFLSGGQDEGRGVVDKAVIDVAGLGRAIQELGPEVDRVTEEAKSKYNLAFTDIQENAATLLAKGIQDGTIEAGDLESARSALQPLVTAAEEQGETAGAAAAEAIQAALDAFASEEGTDLLAGLIDTQGMIDEMESALALAELNLEVGLTLPPDAFPNIKIEAEKAFREAGESGAEGFGEGLEGSTVPPDAAKQMAADALAAAEEALGISSPSTAFAALGRFSADGYAQGLKAGSGGLIASSRQIGRDAMRGFAQGVLGSAGVVYSAARTVADGAARIMRQALKVESPSKVTKEIGEYFGEGLAEGIAESGDEVLAAAVGLANKAMAGMTNVGRTIAKAIGRGFAEEGPKVFAQISSIIQESILEAATPAQQKAALGSSIAAALFANQGARAAGGPLGGPGQIALKELQLAAFNAAAAFSKAAQSTRDQFGAAGRSFALATEAGRANQSAFLDAGQSIRAYMEAQFAAGRHTNAEIINTGQMLRDNLIAAAKAAGASAADINQLVNDLGLSNAQLAEFVKAVNEAAKATEAATAAEKARVKAEADAAAAATAAEAAAKAAADSASETARTGGVIDPVFRDLIIQPVGGDPEAIALYTANRIALQIRK